MSATRVQRLRALGFMLSRLSFAATVALACAFVIVPASRSALKVATVRPDAYACALNLVMVSSFHVRLSKRGDTSRKPRSSQQQPTPQLDPSRFLLSQAHGTTHETCARNMQT